MLHISSATPIILCILIGMFIFIFSLFFFETIAKQRYGEKIREHSRMPVFNTTPLELPAILFFVLTTSCLVLYFNEMFLILLGIEIISFCISTFMCFNLKYNSIQSTKLYYLICSISTIFYLLGCYHLYIITGDLNLNTILKINEYYLVEQLEHVTQYTLACNFIQSAFLIKIGLFPFSF